MQKTVNIFFSFFTSKNKLFQLGYSTFSLDLRLEDASSRS